MPKLLRKSMDYYQLSTMSEDLDTKRVNIQIAVELLVKYVAFVNDIIFDMRSHDVSNILVNLQEKGFCNSICMLLYLYQDACLSWINPDVENKHSTLKDYKLLCKIYLSCINVLKVEV